MSYLLPVICGLSVVIAVVAFCWVGVVAVTGACEARNLRRLTVISNADRYRTSKVLELVQAGVRADEVASALESDRTTFDAWVDVQTKKARQFWLLDPVFLLPDARVKALATPALDALTPAKGDPSPPVTCPYGCHQTAPGCDCESNEIAERLGEIVHDEKRKIRRASEEIDRARKVLKGKQREHRAAVIALSNAERILWSPEDPMRRAWWGFAAARRLAEAKVPGDRVNLGHKTWAVLFGEGDRPEPVSEVRVLLSKDLPLTYLGFHHDKIGLVSVSTLDSPPKYYRLPVVMTDVLPPETPCPTSSTGSTPDCPSPSSPSA